MRSKLLVLFTFLAAPCASAQFTERWTTLVDGGPPHSEDLFARMSSTPSGDIVAAGTTGTSHLEGHPFVTRFDAGGNVLWTRRPAPVGVLESVTGVAVAPDESVLVLSHAGAPGENALRLDKYDALGNHAWTASLAGPAEYPSARSLALDSAQNSYYCGSLRAPGAGPLDEWFDMLIQSHDSNGALRWSLVQDGADGTNDQLDALVRTATGDIVAVGQTNQSAPTERSDSVIVRIAASGAVLWTRTWNTTPPTHHQFVDVVVDPAGIAYALGIASSEPVATRYEIVAYDVSGGVLWARLLPPQRSAHDLEIDANGRLFVGGRTVGQNDNAFVAAYAPTGEPLWERLWDGAAHLADRVDLLRVDPSGEVTAVGSSQTAYAQSSVSRILVLRYSADGTLRDQALVGVSTDSTDVVRDCVVDAAGSIVVCGFRRPVAGGTVGEPDALVARLDPQSFSICIGDGVASPCPCGNTSAAGDQAGCANSTGNGARLADGGMASLAADTLVLTASGEPQSAPTLLVQGSGSSTPLAFGDGLLCVGGALRRMGTRTASVGTVAFPAPGDPSISARAAALGDGIAPGSTRVYQSYYRDPDPTFCAPPAGTTWNVSNGLIVRWGA